MASVIDLYYNIDSPFCNTIILLAKTLGVELNLIPINEEKGEQLTEAFLKLNPEHTIPTIVDNGFAVWESRAILIYLFEKYGKDDSLYPSDPEKRARVNQRLFFDLGTFYQRFANYYYPMYYKLPTSAEDFEKIGTAFEFLDTHLSDQTYAAGNTLTLADFSLAITTLSYQGLGYDFSKYANVVRWFALIKSTVVGWEVVEKNMATFKNYFLQ